MTKAGKRWSFKKYMTVGQLGSHLEKGKTFTKLNYSWTKDLKVTNLSELGVGIQNSTGNKRLKFNYMKTKHCPMVKGSVSKDR